MFFFICLGLLAIIFFRAENKYETNGKKLLSYRYWLFCTVLTIFAAFRLVKALGYGAIGGADAPGYVQVFQICNDPTWQSWDWLQHHDIGFLYINRFIRLLFSDYHIYFFIVYGFIVCSYVLFLKELLIKKTNYIPCLLLIFLYWRSFCTLRSNLAIAFFLFGLVLLYRKKWWGWLPLFFSLLVHKFVLIYFGFIPFYLFFKNKKVKWNYLVIFVVAAAILGSYARDFFLARFAHIDLGGAYQSYARMNMGTSFFDNFWKIVFDQLALAVTIFILRNRIREHINSIAESESAKLNIIYWMCIYDFMMIPVCFLMGVWRGYEFFYLPRIVMWCECLYVAIYNKQKYIRGIYNMFFLILFISWMVFRFYAMWKDSFLMPYIFEPLYLLSSDLQ